MLPIIIGLVLAATGWLPASLGVPSVIGYGIGWIGVLLLAFTAGLETRLSAHLRSSSSSSSSLPPDASRSSVLQFIASAALALLLPFVVGALAAYHYFLVLPNWTTPNGDRALGAIAIGLCIAISALPVLIGIVRELGPSHRPLTEVAVRIAVVDDAVLWIGLALLLFASGDATLSNGSPMQLLAVAVPLALVGLGAVIRHRQLMPPGWAI